MKVLETLRNSYLVVPIIIVATVLFVFIDSKVNNKDVSKKDYINASLFTSLIGALLVFINSENVAIKNDSILRGPAPF